MSLAKVYPMLVAKAERKGRTAEEVYAVTTHLTGYDAKSIRSLLETDISYGDFFTNAPGLHTGWETFKGSVCGVKVENVEEPLMKQIRILDKLVDDLAKGKSMGKILGSLK